MLLFVIPYIIIIYSLRKEVDIMDYISVKAASEKWGISERRIQKLCEENRIDGTEKFGRAYDGLQGDSAHAAAHLYHQSDLQRC